MRVPLSFSFPPPFPYLSLSPHPLSRFSQLVIAINKRDEQAARHALFAIDYREVKKQQRYTDGIAANIAIPRAKNASRLKSQKAKRYYKTNASAPNGGMAIDRLMKTPTCVLFGFFPFFFFHLPPHSNFVAPSQPPICSCSYA